MNLSVGDIIFVLDKKSSAVVPCQLIERISSVTLEGEDVKNIVSSPGGKKFKLEEYDAPWFENYESAYDYLKQSALRLVENTMERAKISAVKNFGYVYDEKKHESSGTNVSIETVNPADMHINEEQTTSISEDTEQVFVDIGGQQVKVTLPKELVNE